MSRRIDIELTSRTGEGAFTWRAAGAKQPKGTVAADILPAGAGVGDVVRAEVDSGLDGLDVVSVLAIPKADEPVANRIEVLGAPVRGPDVSVTYAPGGRRRREDGPGREGGAGRPGRREGAGRRPGAGRGPGDGPDARREPAGQRAEGGPRRERSERPRAEEGEHRPPGAAGRRGAGDDRRGAAPVRRDRRPTVSTTHRNAVLATLGPQELPIAEQLLRGGIPAVRQAIAEQRGRRPAGVATSVNADAVLAIAEQLVPKVNLANWMDRATSAQASGKDLRLRELRAVVTASRTVSLDEEGRTLARSLQESLDQRVTALRDEWLSRMTRALDEGRVVEALGVSARAPEPSTRLPAELAVRLAEVAGSAMTADTDPAEWLPLLDAVVESPVRRTVKPRGIPGAPEAQPAARRAAGSVPELAKLLGLRIPPPPPRRPAAGGPRVMAAGGGARAAGH